jgi:hypothetical protein
MVRAIVAKWAFVCMVVALLGACAPQTQFRSEKLGEGHGGRTVVLMPIDIELSEMQAGGMLEPKADWTDAGRKFLTEAIDKKLNGQHAKLIVSNPDLVLNEPQSIEAKLIRLQEAVGTAIMHHKMLVGAELPTKKNTFDWTLGPEAKALHDRYGSDYALFIWMRDSYTSAGRAAAIVVAALMGVHGLQGGTQQGFASLVDLRTGDVVWFNRMFRQTGDLRNANAAIGTADVLLEKFPK